MRLQANFDELFAGIDDQIDAAQYEAAHARLEALHLEHHCEPFVHLRIHALRWRIAVRQRNAMGMMGQILPILFAVPVSYVQRRWGLALPSRLRNGC